MLMFNLSPCWNVTQVRIPGNLDSFVNAVKGCLPVCLRSPLKKINVIYRCTRQPINIPWVLKSAVFFVSLRFWLSIRCPSDCVRGSFIVHHFNGRELCCAQSTCVVHNEPHVSGRSLIIRFCRFFSLPVQLHGGLLCITFRLSGCHVRKNHTRKKFIPRKVYV